MVIGAREKETSSNHTKSVVYHIGWHAISTQFVIVIVIGRWLIVFLGTIEREMKETSKTKLNRKEKLKDC